MKTFIIYETRMGFRQDISKGMLIDSYPFKASMVQSFEELMATVTENKDIISIISDTSLEDYDKTRLGSHIVYGYASTPDGIRALQEHGIACMGLLKTASKLLDTMSMPVLPTMNNRSSKTDTIASKKQSEMQPKVSQTHKQMQDMKPESVQTQPVSQPKPVSQVQPATQTPLPNMTGMTQEQMLQMFSMFQAMQNGQTAITQTQTTPPFTKTVPAESNESSEEFLEETTSEECEDIPQKAGNRMRTKKNKRRDTSADDEVDSDLLRSHVEEKKTRVVSVYAAKGGVGKTSIAAELGICLALTSNGRRKFRVCIVDYNIDFGDISSTLNLDEKGPNMTYWTEEIRGQISSGANPEDIVFSKQEMEKYYLQRIDKRFDAYALSAPTMHEDSMFIKSAELDTMLRNIIENGEFDYVICDTGNNTRDSSVIAMEKADYILLVVTQDVTTANCNASVLRTLRDTGFETNKVRLIVNHIMPTRETGISVQEVEETFPYPCICRIKCTSDVIKANNTGKPLVLYQPKSDYTKQIRRIVGFVTTGEIIQEEQKKKLFRFSKKRK